MIDLKNLSIEKAHDDLKNGTYTCRDLAQAYLDVISEKNPKLNACLEVYDDVLEQADRAQEMFKNGTDTLLTGIPIAVKDNMLIAGRKVTAGSKILDGYTASYTGAVLDGLINQGAVLLGRTNMDEFAMGSSTQTSGYGITHNPLDVERVPGGSSGGSAAVLAAGMALASLGTETCGSIRQPSAFCGLVGFKPTYGMVSRSGIIAMGNSLDQIGPFGKTVRDAEIVYTALAFNDKKDATSLLDTERAPLVRTPTKKIAVPKDVMKGEGMDKEVFEDFKKSIERFKQIGYEIVEMDFPLMPYSLAVYYILMPAEVSTNLERFDGIRFGYHADGTDNLFDFYSKTRGQGFGREARRRILLGTYVLSHGYYDAYYKKALLLRDAITKELDESFEKIDFFITPTAPTLPFKIGEKMTDPVAMYYSDIFSAPANLAGCPSIAIPTGKTDSGLPTSIQITGPRNSDSELFTLGKSFESVLQ